MSCTVWIVLLGILKFQVSESDEPQPVDALTATQRDLPADALTVLESAPDQEVPADNSTKRPSRTVTRESEGADIVPGLMSPERVEHKSISRSILAAHVHTHFGIAEFGNLREFTIAGEIFEAAQNLMDGADDPANGELAEIIAQSIRVNTELGVDARSTLAGHFPLIRAFGLELTEVEDEQVRAYSVPHAARRRAVNQALAKIAQSAATDAQVALILVPPSVQRTEVVFSDLVDSQARIAFRNVPNVTFIQGGLRQRLKSMPAWDAPDSAFLPICQQILKELHFEEPKSLMLILVREFVTTTNDGYWTQAQQRTYGITPLKDAVDAPEDFEADKVRFAEAFTRDRSAYRPAIALGIALLGVLAFVAYGIALRRSSPVLQWHSGAIIPLAGFLTGAILAPLVVLAMSHGMPEPHSSALASLWWPCTTGALSLILPAGVIRLGLGTTGRYLPSLSCHGAWGLTFLPVAIGVAAGWTAPAVYELEWASLPFLSLLALSGALLLYGFGRATDMADDFPMSFAGLDLALALLFGAGAFLGSFAVESLVAALAFGAMFWHSWRKNHPRQSPAESGEMPTMPSDTNLRVPRTLDELRAALQKPIFQATEESERLRRLIDGLSAQQTQWIGLAGPSAVGKSAAVDAVVRQWRQVKPEIKILTGHCSEKSSAYQPFREALADVGVPQQILSSRSQAGGMNDLFDRLADRFIPFWDFFSGYRDRVEQDDDGDEIVPPPELLAAIGKALQAAAKESGIVLFIDDVQWIDDWSAHVLQHLREEFPPGSEWPAVFILSTRDSAAIERFKLSDDQIVTMPPPNSRRQRQILTKSLGFSPATAKRIVDALGRLGDEPGGMFWLLRAVHELLEQRAVTMTSRGFSLKRSQLKGDRLPIPDSMRQELLAQLKALDSHRSLLECAALLGEKFSVSDLAECLCMDRLDVLRSLRTLEEREQMVRDLPADPDYFVFSSSFVLEVLREELHPPTNNAEQRPQPTKLAREWHLRIASVLERRSPRTYQLLSDLAQHYAAAGRGHERQALEYCLSAARMATRLHRTKEANELFRESQRILQTRS